MQTTTYTSWQYYSLGQLDLSLFFSLHCTRSVTNSCNGWPYMRGSGVRVIMMFHIIKDPVAVQTSHIKLLRVTVWCHNQGFLISYTRTDIYKTFLVHRHNLTMEQSFCSLRLHWHLQERVAQQQTSLNSTWRVILLYILQTGFYLHL